MTPDSMTVANPDGTLTTTTTAQPTRMKNADGAWVAIDPTLKQNPDGSIGTTATPNTLKLSGGGSGPVISVADSSGHAMALALPVNLPAPTLSGASATYANIYPGVDLTVTAEPSGSFSEVLIAQNPAAAARLSTITFHTSLTGLKLSTEASGRIDARDSATGTLVATAAPPAMWDSASTSRQEPYASTSRAPGRSAHAAALPVTLGTGTLSLHADLTRLGATPTYPLYLDPTWRLPYQSGGEQAYVEVQGGGTNTSGGSCQYDTNFDNEAALTVGYNDYGYCVGPDRAYYQIDTSNVLNPAYDIKGATLKINETSSAWNDCDQGSETISIYLAGPIGTGTDWRNQPGPLGSALTSKTLESDGNSSGTKCPGGTVPGDFDASGLVNTARAANPQWQNVTFVMIGNETAGSHSAELFNNNPSITTVYDIPPGAPTNLATSPVPVVNGGPNAGGGTQSCGTGTAYVGVASLNGTNAATLSAELTSQVPSAQMYGQFHLTDHSTSPSTETYINSSGYVTTGGTVSVQTPALTDGHVYTWEVTSSDQYDTSATTGYCTFVADETLPTNPTVTSTDFPSSGSGTTSTKYSGQTGTLTLSATDPNPSSGTASGLRGYYYSLDTPIPVNGANFTAASGTASISITPAQWGTHTLYAQAIDNAGNISGQSQYSFYVPWNQAASPHAGDLTGDGRPDLLAANTVGNLVIYPGNADPAATPVLAATPTTSPGGAGIPWNKFLITHRGSFTNQGVDDLWAYDTVGHGLYLYKNLGTNPFQHTGNVVQITKADVANDAYNTSPTSPDNATTACATTTTGSCATYDNTDWSTVTQILAVGDFYSGDPVGSYDNGAPGLLTVEGGSLWYYQGQTSQFYLGTAIQLGTSGWNNVTLLAPGTVGGKPALWARDNSTGAVYQYLITFDANGYPKNLGTPATADTSSNQIASGFTASTYTNLASPGDVNGDGYPDLYATDKTGHLDYYAGTSTGMSSSPTYVGPVDDPTHQWPLTDGTGSTATDVIGGLNATLSSSGASWYDDTTRGQVLKTDGTSGYAATTTSAIDTTESYTVSVWADPAKTNPGAILGQDGTNISGQILYVNASDGWTFAMAPTDSTTWSADRADTAANTAAIGTWTHLVATYDQPTGTMALYVNGALAATSKHTTTWNATGPFAIGRDKVDLVNNAFFDGEISDVETYNTALSPAQAAALYNGNGPITQLS